MLSQNEVKELVDQAIQDDSQAFAGLYKAYYKGILGFCVTRLGPEHRQFSEDLCQDTFIKAKDKLLRGEYNTEFSFYTFLRNIANSSYKKYKKNHSQLNNMPAFSYDPSAWSDLFEVVLQCCAKPHQIISFLCTKLLKSWNVIEFVRHCGEKTLYYLYDEFFNDYFLLYEEYFTSVRRSYFKNLILRKMDKNFETIYPENEYSRLRQYDNSFVGNLRLNMFFTRNAAHCIYDWNNKVKKRAGFYLEKGILCRNN